jgi:hypothetical protein
MLTGNRRPGRAFLSRSAAQELAMEGLDRSSYRPVITFSIHRNRPCSTRSQSIPVGKPDGQISENAEVTARFDDTPRRKHCDYPALRPDYHLDNVLRALLIKTAP